MASKQSRSEEYRERAGEADHWADRTPDQNTKALYRDMAEEWRRLAEMTERESR